MCPSAQARGGRPCEGALPCAPRSALLDKGRADQDLLLRAGLSCPLDDQGAGDREGGGLTFTRRLRCADEVRRLCEGPMASPNVTKIASRGCTHWFTLHACSIISHDVAPSQILVSSTVPPWQGAVALHGDAQVAPRSSEAGWASEHREDIC